MVRPLRSVSVGSDASLSQSGSTSAKGFHRGEIGEIHKSWARIKLRYDTSPAQPIEPPGDAADSAAACANVHCD